MERNDEVQREGVGAVPYIAHEGIMVRMERTNRRLVIALILAILLMFASNALWLWAWMQYNYMGEDMTTTTTTTVNRTVDINGKDGIASYIGGSGSIINGKDNSDYDGLYDESDETEASGEEEEWNE